MLSFEVNLLDMKKWNENTVKKPGTVLEKRTIDIGLVCSRSSRSRGEEWIRERKNSRAVDERSRAEMSGGI